MIIILLGGIGSGKTLSAVKEIANNKQYAITNFRTNFKNSHRIKVTDIIKYSDDKKTVNVNWEFWENVKAKHPSYSIFLDEIHNLIHSRKSMSKTNILMSKWVSQIRKILSDHPNNHLYLISQTMRKIDVDFRELASLIITCQKADYKGKILIKQDYYNSFMDLEMGYKAASRVFSGNEYFKHYKSTELVTFSDADEYV